jgi:hypothetical protein
MSGGGAVLGARRRAIVSRSGRRRRPGAGRPAAYLRGQPPTPSISPADRRRQRSADHRSPPPVARVIAIDFSPFTKVAASRAALELNDFVRGAARAAGAAARAVIRPSASVDCPVQAAATLAAARGRCRQNSIASRRATWSPGRWLLAPSGNLNRVRAIGTNGSVVDGVTTQVRCVGNRCPPLRYGVSGTRASSA